MSILNLEGVSTGTPLNSLIRPTPFLKRLKTNRQDAVFIAIVLAHQVGKQVAAYCSLSKFEHFRHFADPAVDSSGKNIH